MAGIWDTLWYIPVGVLALFPMLLWGYLFSYLDNSPLNARRFCIGIFAGVLAVLPVLFLEDILRVLHLESLDAFTVLASASPTPNSLTLTVTVAGILAVMSAVILILGAIAFPARGTFPLRVYLRNSSIFVISSLVFLVLPSVLGIIPGFSDVFADGVTVGGNVFRTLGAICVYYTIVGLTEEGTKHWSFLASSLSDSTTLRRGLVFSAFVALGFAFAENILYLHALLSAQGGLDGAFFTTWSMRSIFSTFVHVLCGMILAHAFFRVYTVTPTYGVLSSGAMRILVSGIGLAVLAHAIFDISLTGGFTAIIFVYAIVGYLSITGMFYREEAY